VSTTNIFVPWIPTTMFPHPPDAVIPLINRCSHRLHVLSCPLNLSIKIFVEAPSPLIDRCLLPVY
jgi:hypothetical protein